ncbi:FAD-binding monooxygenase ausC [Lasiodiplodia hormozganensis]|uniref:FAD-binding monooxygenase ausC n=1 Tax=Lasiodiplodia hormozganensis TaxID=869390 RepID=A0AA40CSN9_9PEZI|nr:FAD-binding monooxygenase ausC [Lasiodiplodia hormozganensis]
MTSSASALFQKYAEERDKRLRPEKLDQYIDFRDPSLSSMDADPYVDYDALAAKDRPLKDDSDIKVLIVGGGMLGVTTAYRLVTEAGINSNDIVIVDKAGGFGGTWYWNRYPGVACDIESYCYVPLLEETGYMPKHRYSYGHEIREHLERIANTANVRGQFCTAVTHQQWDDEAKRWAVTLQHNPGPGREREELKVRAQFLVLAGGVVRSPHVPKLNGVDVFRSAPNKLLMHTGRWDWSHSGGSPEKPDLEGLRGKRVGVIGTGATAIQVVPHVARWANHTYVFQRTPSYVGPHLQKELTPADWARVAYKPGWQAERMASLEAMFTGKPDAENIVQDSWTEIPGMRVMTGHAGRLIAKGEEEQHLKEVLELDHPWTEAMRARVDAQVKDPLTAEKLKPWYPSFCKRPTFHESYLALFNEPNVSLVDTDGRGVEAYTPDGVRANGVEYELDVLVLATGYTFGILDSCPSSSLNAPLLGVGGRPLKDKWDAGDFGTFYGVMTNGFPNLFFASGSGGSVSQNATSFYTLASRLISHTVKGALQQAEGMDRVTVEVSKKAENEWTMSVAKRARWFSPYLACTPGFATGEGILQEVKEQTEEEEMEVAKKAGWGEGSITFRQRVDDWMATGRLDGLLIQSY